MLSITDLGLPTRPSFAPAPPTPSPGEARRVLDPALIDAAVESVGTHAVADAVWSALVSIGLDKLPIHATLYLAPTESGDSTSRIDWLRGIEWEYQAGATHSLRSRVSDAIHEAAGLRTLVIERIREDCPEPDCKEWDCFVSSTPTGVWLFWQSTTAAPTGCSHGRSICVCDLPTAVPPAYVVVDNDDTPDEGGYPNRLAYVAYHEADIPRLLRDAPWVDDLPAVPGVAANDLHGFRTSSNWANFREAGSAREHFAGDTWSTSLDCESAAVCDDTFCDAREVKAPRITEQSILRVAEPAQVILGEEIDDDF